MLLSEGLKGDSFIILSIESEFKIKKRLQDMGLTQGVKVKIMSYYSNNAFILNVRGSRVVIGRDIADKIIVEQNHCNHCTRKRFGRRRRALHHSILEDQHGA